MNVIPWVLFVFCQPKNLVLHIRNDHLSLIKDRNRNFVNMRTRYEGELFKCDVGFYIERYILMTSITQRIYNIRFLGCLKKGQTACITKSMWVGGQLHSKAIRLPSTGHPYWGERRKVYQVVLTKGRRIISVCVCRHEEVVIWLDLAKSHEISERWKWSFFYFLLI